MRNLAYFLIFLTFFSSCKEKKKSSQTNEIYIDNSKYFDKTKQRAEEGNAVSEYNLAVKYAKGEGTEIDKEKAIYWATKSAEQGYRKAQYNLGKKYFQGFGVQKSQKQSAYWIKKAYENGYELAKDFWDENELWKYE